MIAFAAVFAPITTIAGIATGLADTHIQVIINEVAIELQGAVIDLQTTMSSIQTEYQQVLGANENLKQQLIAHERREQESSRYALQQNRPGIFVYALNDSDTAGEPKHWLCPNCYQDRKKAILQRTASGSIPLICPKCKWEVITDEPDQSAYFSTSN